MSDVFEAAALLREHHDAAVYRSAQSVLDGRRRRKLNLRKSLNTRPVRAAVLRALLARDSSICQWCGEWFEIDLDAFCEPWDATSDVGLGEAIVIDHIHPISKGGDGWDLRNMQVLHPVCNIRKGNRI